jgi:glycosyltransferase involved in cell wall biosynthesis
MKNKKVVMVVFHAKLSPRQRLMLRSLKGLGWNVSVVAWDRGGQRLVPEESAEFVDRWHWVAVEAPILGGMQLLKRLPFYYYHLFRCLSNLNKPDLWIVCHFWLLGCIFFFPGKKLYDASEMHSVDISFHLRFFRNFTKNFISFVEGLLISRMDGVLTVDSKNGWLQQYYQRWTPNVEVIWNVPSKLDDPAAEDVNTLAREYSGRKVVVDIGGLKDNKGLSIAILTAAKVIVKHPDSLFLFIGSMRGDENEIKALICANNLGDHIRFLPWLPYGEMLTHLQHAKVGLALYQDLAHYPLLSAGNGRKFFSYMQAGIPIIGPSFGEVGLAVRIAECGILVHTDSVSEVSSAINILLDKPETAARMATNGRRAFVQHFNWEKEEKIFLALVERVLN